MKRRKLEPSIGTAAGRTRVCDGGLLFLTRVFVGQGLLADVRRVSLTFRLWPILS